MKKLVCMILAMAMALSMVACGGKEEMSVSTDGATSMQKAINAKVYLQCHRYRHP